MRANPLYSYRRPGSHEPRNARHVWMASYKSRNARYVWMDKLGAEIDGAPTQSALGSQLKKLKPLLSVIRDILACIPQYCSHVSRPSQLAAPPPRNGVYLTTY